MYMSQPINHFTQKPYSGCNVEILQDGEWATFLQWSKNGYRVRKGEKGKKIVRYVEIEKVDKKTKKAHTETIPRTFTLFNAEQVDQVTPKNIK